MKRNHFFIFFFILFSSISGMLFAQSNAVIDKLLEEGKADYGRSVYMILSAAEIVDENIDIPGALKTLADKQWKGLVNKKADDVITLGDYSFLVMEAFAIPGGIMYHLMPGPRYAVRELKYMGFIEETDSSRVISGDEVLRILGYVMDWKEKEL